MGYIFNFFIKVKISIDFGWHKNKLTRSRKSKISYPSISKSEDSLIKEIKTAFGLFLTAWSTIFFIGSLFTLTYFILYSSFFMLYFFLAMFFNYLGLSLFLLIFWKRNFSLKSHKLDDKDIFEIVRRYTKRVRPCLPIAIVLAIITFFLLKFLHYFEILTVLFLFFALFSFSLHAFGGLLKSAVSGS